MAEPECRIAVLVPCLNEESTIAKVVSDFKRQLPAAEIYVYDNGSKDRTVQEATLAQAIVRHESRRGKGAVVQAMFQQVDADVYVLVDGDDTYPAERVHDLIAPILAREADMVVGSRLMREANSEFRSLNWFGNKVYLYLISTFFRTILTDMLSGFRALNRTLVKGVPLFVRGFDIETELTIKALERGYRITEIPVALRARPKGSYSKIRVVQDGLLILRTIMALFRDYKPLTFFGSATLVLTACGMLIGWSAISEYLATGLIHHGLRALFAGILIAGAMLSLVIGVVLHAVSRRFQELEYYLRLLIRE